MKLFTKYNRINLLATIVIFLFASIAFYLVLRFILISKMDDELRIELIESILLITFSTILLILIATLIINRLLLKRLWKPFYDTLNIIKQFKLDKMQSLKFPVTEIEEFSVMNQTLAKTTDLAQQDYL